MSTALFLFAAASWFAGFVTVVDYWSSRAMFEELWARRVLGDEVYERNARKKPKPPEPSFHVLGKAIPVPKPEPVILEKTWPLLEVGDSGTIVIRAAKKPKAVASTLTIAARNFIPPSATHKVIGIPPHTVVERYVKEELASVAPPWED